jgi:hypothetical protein
LSALQASAIWTEKSKSGTWKKRWEWECVNRAQHPIAFGLPMTERSSLPSLLLDFESTIVIRYFHTLECYSTKDLSKILSYIMPNGSKIQSILRKMREDWVQEEEVEVKSNNNRNSNHLERPSISTKWVRTMPQRWIIHLSWYLGSSPMKPQRKRSVVRGDSLNYKYD